MENVTLGTPQDEEKEIFLKACRNITFKGVKTISGAEPIYSIEKDTVFNFVSD